jgi:hypothetical protein
MLLAQPLNLNVAPVDVRDEGARLSRTRAWAANCVGAGISCTSDAGVWTLNVAGGGGGGSTPTVSCAADQALSWDGAAWSCVSKVSAAYAADASVTAQALATDPTACSAGQYVSDVAANGTLTCSTPPSGGYSTVQDEGSALTARTTINFTGAGVSCVDNGGATRTDCTISGGGAGSATTGVFSVTFGNGTVATGDSATATVSAGWVTSTSSIVFTPACSQVTGSTTAQECALVLPECVVLSITASTSFDVQCWSEVGGFGSYPISYSGT